MSNAVLQLVVGVNVVAEISPKYFGKVYTL